MSKLFPQPSEAQTATIMRLRRLSRLLDSAIRIPGTSYRIGLDPLFGLFPGGGDFLGTALSAYIVIEAARMGVSRAALAQMVSNIIVDTVSGSVPVLGDLVDLTWKANVKNMVLLEEHLNIPHPQPRKQTDWLFLALLLAGLLLVVMVMAAISVMLLRWLWTSLFG